jgi:hypothetical protein
VKLVSMGGTMLASERLALAKWILGGDSLETGEGESGGCWTGVPRNNTSILQRNSKYKLEGWRRALQCLVSAVNL